jgi:predicted aspartyl protease
LREALGARARSLSQVAVAETAGSAITLENWIRIGQIQLGDVRIRNITAFVGDFHIFDMWGFQEEPTLLIGMDVLSQAREIVIDYRRGSVHFRTSGRNLVNLRVGGAGRLTEQR